jgi:hypothetical protein
MVREADLTNTRNCGTVRKVWTCITPSRGRSEVVKMTQNLYSVPAAVIVFLVLVELLSIKERLAVGRVRV